MPRYVPEAGDIVWLNFTPQAGSEQAGHRPALVISVAFGDTDRALVTIVPHTTSLRGSQFEIPVASPAPSPNVLSFALLHHFIWRGKAKT